MYINPRQEIILQLCFMSMRHLLTTCLFWEQTLDHHHTFECLEQVSCFVCTKNEKKFPSHYHFNIFHHWNFPKKKRKRPFVSGMLSTRRAAKQKQTKKPRLRKCAETGREHYTKPKKLMFALVFFLFEGCPTPPTPQVQSQERSIYLYIHAHVFKFTQPHIYTNIYIYIYRYAVVVSLCDSQTAVQSFSLWRRVDVWKDDNT